MTQKKPRRYPKLDAAIKAKGSARAFCRWAKISEQCYLQIQSGLHLPNYFTIIKCLEYTGLTFEEAFQEQK